MVILKAVGTVFFSVAGLIALALGIYRIFRPLSVWIEKGHTMLPPIASISVAAVALVLAVVLFFETKKEYQFYKTSQ